MIAFRLVLFCDERFVIVKRLFNVRVHVCTSIQNITSILYHATCIRSNGMCCLLLQKGCLADVLVLGFFCAALLDVGDELKETVC